MYTMSFCEDTPPQGLILFRKLSKWTLSHFTPCPCLAQLSPVRLTCPILPRFTLTNGVAASMKRTDALQCIYLHCKRITVTTSYSRDRG